MRHPLAGQEKLSMEIEVLAVDDLDTWRFELRWPSTGVATLVIPDPGGQMDCCARYPRQAEWIAAHVEKVSGVNATWATTFDIEAKAMVPVLGAVLNRGWLSGVAIHARAPSSVAALLGVPVSTPGEARLNLWHPFGKDARVESLVRVPANTTHLHVHLDGFPGTLSSETATTLQSTLHQLQQQWSGRCHGTTWHFPLARWADVVGALIRIPAAPVSQAYLSFSFAQDDNVRARNWLGAWLDEPHL